MINLNLIRCFSFSLKQTDKSIEDGFEKLLKIGEGSYGVVYSAVDRKTKRKVALKRIRLDHSG